VMAYGCVVAPDLPAGFAADFFATVPSPKNLGRFRAQYQRRMGSGQAQHVRVDSVVIRTVYAGNWLESSSANTEHMHRTCTIRGFPR
jgi:hypothetical protein